MNCLQVLAHVSSILTATVAIIVSGHLWLDRYRKRTALVDYLKNEKAKNPENYQHTIMHLMANLAITEAEILHAAFQSRHIQPLVRENKNTGLADTLLFEYRT